MTSISYQVRFVTPAFLGNAEQHGQWRMPPFKALLRQWWRVAYAADHGFDVDIADMRREEGLLFGHAWLDDDYDDKGRTVRARKSQVRIRLDRWDEGKLGSWNGLERGTVYHPEVQKTDYKVGPHAYLGYGPLAGRSETRLDKRNAAIQANETATLSLAYPETHSDPEIGRILQDNQGRIPFAFWLMDRYGTVGGRSRNGWGSISLQHKSINPVIPAQAGIQNGLLGRIARPLEKCLEWDWPHAVGKDDKGPLIWQTARTYDDWKLLMRDLAIIKIGLRTQFVFPNVASHPRPLQRHWLSYPITRHTTKAWRGSMRLPNSLRFKVRQIAGGRCVGLIFHMPCLPPPDFTPDQHAIIATWQTVHALLEELTRPASNRRYERITDPARRSQLRPQLDTINLTRIPE